MKRIIKTVLEKGFEASQDVISGLLEMPELLSQTELDVIDRIQEDRRLSGNYPPSDILREGFPSFFFGWDEVEPLESEGALRVYASRVAEDKRRMKTSETLVRLSEDVMKRGLTFDDLESLRSLARDDGEKNENLLSFDYIKDFEDETTRPKGYRSFVTEIDEDITAFDSGSIVTIFAFTSQYKTTFAQNICWKNAMEGKNSVYISLEVPKRMILWKMIFSFAQLERFRLHPTYWDIFTNKDWMKKNEPKRYEDLVNCLFMEIIPAFEAMEGKIIVFDESDFPVYSESAFRKKIEEADDAMGGKLDGVFFDQASLMKFDGGKRNDSYSGEAINRFVTFIRRMGNAFRKNEDGSWRQLTSIILAQANRQSFLAVAKDTENVGRYSLTGIAEANEIERASSYVMSVFTNNEMRQGNQATVQLLKCRNGRVLEDPITVECNGKAGFFGNSAFVDLRGNRPIEADKLDMIADVAGGCDGWEDVFGDSESFN